MLDYGIKIKNVPIYCDNTSAISLRKDSVLHCTKNYIEIRHHFLRDHYLKGDISLKIFSILDQLVETFTKPLKEVLFNDIRLRIGICDMNSL